MGQMVVLYFIHEVCIVDEVIFTISQCWGRIKHSKSIHLGTAYSSSSARMEIPFLKWDGGSRMTLGMGIKYFNSSGYKKCRERTWSICPKTLLGTCCLLYLEQSLWLLDGRPLHPFLSFEPEGNFHLPPVFFQGHLSLNLLQKFQAKRLL